VRLQWAAHNSDADAAGNSYGYLTASVAMREAVRAAGVEITDDADTALHFLHPANFEPIPGKRNVIFTMYEAFPVPPEFERGFSEADHVIVPSKFCLDLFTPALKAARRRAHVVPLGFDPKVWTYELRRPPRDEGLRGPFVFLHCGAPNARKGGIRLANAWKLSGFAQCDDFLLYLKTTDENGPGKIVRMGNTIFDSRKLPRAELVDLFHKAHCAVLPSTGEGFGLILAEALATGLPLITTKYGGQLDFVDETVCSFVTHTFDETTDILGWKHREAFADVGSLGRKMLEVLKDYPRALKKAAHGALRMHSSFTWAHAGMKLRSVLEQIEQKRAA